MVSSRSLAKKEREQIFCLFVTNHKLTFGEIEKRIKIRSNMVAYHLGCLVKEGFLIKKGEYYYLTASASKYIPLFSSLQMRDIGPFVIVLVAVRHKDSILLIKRTKRPYKDYWAMLGGKVLLDEDIRDASLRIVLAKSGLIGKFDGINGIMHERVQQDGDIVHNFILIMTTVNVTSGKLQAANLAWKKSIPKNTVPSDLWLIQNKLSSRKKMKNILMSENDGVLSNIQWYDY